MMEVPEINIEDSVGFHKEYSKYYFNLYALKHNENIDKIDNTSKLITIKEHLDKKIVDAEESRIEDLNELGYAFLLPLDFDSKVERNIMELIENHDIGKIMEGLDVSSSKKKGRVRLLIFNIFIMKALNFKNLKTDVINSYPSLRGKLNEFKEKNLPTKALNLEWSYRLINGLVSRIFKNQKKVILYSAHRMGLNRVLDFIFENHRINKEIPEWDKLSVETKRKLIEDENFDYGFHQMNLDWIIKTFQILKKDDYPKEEELNNPEILDKVKDIPGRGQSDNRVAKQTKLLYKYKFGYSISIPHVKRINGLI